MIKQRSVPILRKFVRSDHVLMVHQRGKMLNTNFFTDENNLPYKKPPGADLLVYGSEVLAGQDDVNPGIPVYTPLVLTGSRCHNGS